MPSLLDANSAAAHVEAVSTPRAYTVSRADDAIEVNGWALSFVMLLWILGASASGSDEGVPPEMDCPDRRACVSSRAAAEDKRVEPLRYTGDARDALSRLAAIVASMRGAEVADSAERYLHVTFTSRVFRFVDDVWFVVRDENVIDLRSASRFGLYDFGVNRSRIESIRKAFDAGQATR